MKDMIEKIRQMSRVPEDAEVDAFVKSNGEGLSIPLLEAALKQRKEDRRKILSKDLLEWMQEHDMFLFEGDGFRVTIKSYMSAKVQDETKAFKWLEDNSYRDLIKDTLSLPKGEFTEDLRDTLEDLGVSYTKKSGIHPQTLKKALTDRQVAGEVLPDEEDGFTVKFYDECEVKDV